MPNFDAGHYFLNTLTPIRTKPPKDGLPGSYSQRIKIALAKLPTALQSPATEKINKASPFSKSMRTHMCRYSIIDDVVYNGRNGANPLLSAIKLRDNPLTPQHIDSLPCPYLFFAADFDAIIIPGDKLKDNLSAAEQDAVRDDYLRELWQNSSTELLDIYRNCQGFDEDKIKTGEEFAAYLAKCQIETWMPFNDYYLEMPKLKPLPVKLFATAVLGPLAASVLAALSWLTGFSTWFGYSTGWITVVSLLLTVVIGYSVYSHILNRGKQPWPAAKFGSLSSVLKGLYIQQKFSDFVISNQGKNPSELYAAFGDWLKEHKPENVLENTQVPGVIKTK